MRKKQVEETVTVFAAMNSKVSRLSWIQYIWNLRSAGYCLHREN